ncbi:MAG: lipid A export permease/ATP-binding protein MsbA [Gammaproteobacteria bacterium]|nr:lipid A export permease/ATP-binding protein MsbA [Gammaproteobacteria bacterium]
MKHTWQTYRRLLTYVRPYLGALLLALFASMVYSAIDAWFVYFLKPLINRGLVGREQDFLKMAPFLVLIVFVLRGMSSFVSNYNIATVSRSVIMQLRQDLFAHLQKCPARFYDHTTSGQLLSTMLYTVEQVANASADVLSSAVQSLFFVIFLLGVMFYNSWKLSLLYFVIMPIIALIMRYTSRRVRKLSLTIQTSMASLTHISEENIEGYQVIRGFGGEQYERDKFNKATRINRQQEMKTVAARSWSVSSVQLIAAMALSLTLFIAAKDIAHAVLSPGGFVAMVAAMLAILKPLKDLTSMQNKLYRGIAGAETVFTMLDEPTEQDTGTRSLTRAKGKLILRDVGFSYDQNIAVLSNVSFSIQPGEIVALVGHSGSGKSTLVSLLPRFYPEYIGDILLDDISIRDYQLQDLRRQFAIVSQQVILFNDTIRNNIAYGCLRNVSFDEVRAAARSAFALDFIESLPNGFDSLVGENGVLLSGGQRQRIASARAILKNAPILILDEATSALDTESERYIQAALDAFMQNRTTLVIAHRLSTVEHANKIIVFDRGRVIETGTHTELLQREGHYAHLYRMQFRDVESSSC